MRLFIGKYPALCPSSILCNYILDTPDSRVHIDNFFDFFWIYPHNLLFSNRSRMVESGYAIVKTLNPDLWNSREPHQPQFGEGGKNDVKMSQFGQIWIVQVTSPELPSLGKIKISWIDDACDILILHQNQVCKKNRGNHWKMMKHPGFFWKIFFKSYFYILLRT